MREARQMGISQRQWWNHVKHVHASLEEEWLSALRGIPAANSASGRDDGLIFLLPSMRKDVFHHFHWCNNTTVWSNQVEKVSRWSSKPRVFLVFFSKNGTKLIYWGLKVTHTILNALVKPINPSQPNLTENYIKSSESFQVRKDCKTLSFLCVNYSLHTFTPELSQFDFQTLVRMYIKKIICKCTSMNQTVRISEQYVCNNDERQGRFNVKSKSVTVAREQVGGREKAKAGFCTFNIVWQYHKDWCHRHLTRRLLSSNRCDVVVLKTLPALWMSVNVCYHKSDISFCVF